MGNENQGLIIELPEDLTAAAAAGWVSPDVEDAEEKVSPKEGKDKVNGQTSAIDPTVFDTIKRERDEAIARARALEEERQKDIASRDARLTEVEETSRKNEVYALRAHHEKVQGDLNQIDTVIRSTQMTLEALSREELAAEEAGERERAQKARRMIAKAEAELVQLEAGKAGAEQEVLRAKQWLADGIKPKPKTETKTEEAPKVEAKKVEEPKRPSKDEWLADLGNKTSSKVVQWLKDHPEFTDDPKQHQKWLAFTNAFVAVDEGDLKGDAFLDALNSKFFPEKERRMTEEDDKPQVADKKKAPPGAPVTRSGDFYSSKNPSGSKLRLHPRLVNAAKEIGSDPEVYAKNVKQMIAEGKYPKNYLDWDYQENLK